MQVVPFETVLREACAAGCAPIAVYATEKAMRQENVPLSEALRTFVKHDNRLFKQEMLQSNRMGHKRGAGVGDGSQSKRLQRSASADSMASNRASAGDMDDYMTDTPFGSGAASGGGVGMSTPQDEDMPDLVELPGDVGQTSAPLPSYQKFMEMETGMSPTFAQVSLQDAKSSDPPAPWTQEMQERPNAQFLTRPATNNGAARASAAQEELLIDLGSDDAGTGVLNANGA